MQAACELTDVSQVARILCSTTEIAPAQKIPRLCKSCTAQDHNFLVGTIWLLVMVICCRLRS